MGRCVICGVAVDGRICESHEEDVVFEFRGQNAEQLTPGRFYEGRVDGYADFGVFVDIGESVTGLLHQSEIDRRLESLTWEPGDPVYVKVLRVRDNGDVDLGWSIRQRERDFRGKLVDDPSADHELTPEEADGEETTDEAGGSAGPSVGEPGPVSRSGEDAGAAVASAEAGAAATDGDRSGGASGSSSASGAVAESERPAPERVAVAALDDRVGDRVTVEGDVASVRQTGGPTIFEVADETGTVDVAAFDGAGVRAYPDVEAEAVVRVVGEVERRREELQVESESLEVLEGEAAEDVRERMAAALDERARPDEVEPLADHEPVAAVRDAVVDAATAIRRAVFEARPIVVRHTATADGYVAGAAIERAVLPLVRAEHARTDAEYHFFDRRPLADPVYGMDDATADVSNMLEDRERHDEPLPLVVLVDAGGTEESLEGLGLLSVYGVEHLVVDAGPVDDAVVEAVETVVSPSVAGADGAGVTATALAVDVALHVDDDVRADLAHLPAVSYWADVPDVYAGLADEAGYDETATRELREAVELSAYYQTYEDKRQLVTDLLFGEATTGGDARGLAAHVSEQFREKLAGALRTARANVDRRTVDGVEVAVLDAERFVDRFEFPPISLLVDVLHREDAADDDRVATVAATTDELYVRSGSPVDLRAVAEAVDGAVPDAGTRAVGGDRGRLEFVAGEREPVLDGAVEAVAAQLGD